MGIRKTGLFTGAQHQIAAPSQGIRSSCPHGHYSVPPKKERLYQWGSRASIGQHLRELRDIGIVEGTIEGSRISDCPNPTRWTETKSRSNELFHQFAALSAEECC